LHLIIRSGRADRIQEFLDLALQMVALGGAVVAPTSIDGNLAKLRRRQAVGSRGADQEDPNVGGSPQGTISPPAGPKGKIPYPNPAGARIILFSPALLPSSQG
jgi:hypothetical protein